MHHTWIICVHIFQLVSIKSWQCTFFHFLKVFAIYPALLHLKLSLSAHHKILNRKTATDLTCRHLTCITSLLASHSDFWWFTDRVWACSVYINVSTPLKSVIFLCKKMSHSHPPASLQKLSQQHPGWPVLLLQPCKSSNKYSGVCTQARLLKLWILTMFLVHKNTCNTTCSTMKWVCTSETLSTMWDSGHYCSQLTLLFQHSCWWACNLGHISALITNQSMAPWLEPGT